MTNWKNISSRSSSRRMSTQSLSSSQTKKKLSSGWRNRTRQWRKNRLDLNSLPLMKGHELTENRLKENKLKETLKKMAEAKTKHMAKVKKIETIEAKKTAKEREVVAIQKNL